ncbi:MAG: HNH endonuclease family protein [Bdellovibrio sp.]
MKTFFLSLLLFVATPGFAQQTANGNIHFDEYYTVKESNANSDQLSLNPLDTAKEIWNLSQTAHSLKNFIYSLLEFDHHNEPYGNVDEPYNRQKHFGTWFHDPRDNNCYNTRAKVLIRDSSVEVTFSRSGCTVATGDWVDPYAGGEYTQARDIQIDHFVPLKNAYISGGYKWSPHQRCLYANFLGNKFHLLPVYGQENTKKSDMSPVGYMPPNSDYACTYLEQWLKVKMIWKLGITPPEKEAIEALVQEHNCDSSEMTFSAEELQQQRQFMDDNMDLCTPEDSMQKITH